LADLLVVEGRVLEVEAVHREVADGAERFDLEVRIAVEHGQQVGRKLFDVGDLAAHAGIGGGQRVGHDVPDDVVDIDHFAAGQCAGGFLAGDVIGVLDVHRRDARLELGDLERAGTGHVGNGGADGNFGNALGHHEGGRARGLGQRAQCQVGGFG